MKALRIVLAVLAGALVLLVIVAIIAIQSFDLNDYKDEITAFVQQETGRTLTIDENIEFSLFPWFAVETGGVSLSDDPDFGDRSFVTVDSLSARVRVWPLLKRRIEVGRVVLDGVNLNLGVDAEGRGNWDSILRTPAPGAPEAGLPAPQRPSFEALAVEGISFRNARILWHDAEGEVTHIVRNVTLVTGPINNDDPVDVSVSLSLLDVASQASAEIDLESVASLRPEPGLDMIEATVRLLDSREVERATATVRSTSVRLDAGVIRSGPASLAADLVRPPLGPELLSFEADLASLDFNADDQTVVVNGLTARSGDLEARFNLRGEAVTSNPRIAGSAEVQSGSITAVFDFLGRQPPPGLAADDTSGVAAVADLDLRLGTQELTVDRFVLSALGIDASGRAERSADGRIVAEIELPPFAPSNSLRALVAAEVPEGVDLGAVSSVSLRAGLVMEPDSTALEVSDFSAMLDSAGFNGSLTIDDLDAPSEIVGTIRAAGLDDRLLAALFGPWLPSELAAAELGEFSLTSDFDYDIAASNTALDRLEITAYGLSADGQLNIAAAGSSVALSGRATLEQFSPRELLARFDLPVPATSDPTALGSAVVSASFDTSGSNGEFRDIAIELDDSRITGEFSVLNFDDPSYRFLLRADRIDVDRYLLPTAAEQDDDGERVLGEMRLASEPLTATAASGSASVGQLTIGGMEFEQLSTDVAFGGGLAAINSVRTELYGGTFAGSLTIDATGESSVVHLTGDTRAVALEPLLTAMLGASHIRGTGDITLDLTGRGDTINRALETAAGSMSVSLRNGQLEGINLGFELCEEVNMRRGLPPPASAPDATSYSLIRASATVAEGIASSSDILATTGYLELTGRGGIRLVDQWLDNQFRARLTGPVPIMGCEDLNRTIANDPIPVNFTLEGRLPDVDVGLDVSQLIQDWIRREARQRAQDEVRDAIINRLLN